MPWSGSRFLTKTTQALLVLPAIGLTYLVWHPSPLGRRLLHGVGAGAAAVVAAGWWVVLAVTSDAAPYAGQTTTGSFVDYILGINGLDRIAGGSGPGTTTPSVVPGDGGGCSTARSEDRCHG